MLIAKGVTFKSETDTEVAVNLIQYFYEGDIKKAVAEAALRMEGSYALGISARTARIRSWPPARKAR